MKKMCVTFHPWLIAALLTLPMAYPALGWAADKEQEVRPKDTLGQIVADNYKGYDNRSAIMQAILKASPDAFIDGDINRLIVGKSLKLPDANSIPDIRSAAKPETSNSQDPALLEKLKVLEAGRAALEKNLKVLEEENTSLQDMVKQYEEAKQAKDAELAKLEARVRELEDMLAASGKNSTVAASASPAGESQENADTELATLKANISSLQTENTDLKDQLDKARQSLGKNQRETETLKAQLSDIQRLNTQLNNDLQQSQTANKVSSTWLPWTLLGLLAVLMLPLLWLVRRHRDEPVITTVTAPPKPAPITATPPVHDGGHQTYSDTSLPPMPITSEIREEETVPENPDAELKLDIARAYLDLRDSEAAAEVLQEILLEGGTRQKREAREILSFIA